MVVHKMKPHLKVGYFIYSPIQADFYQSYLMLVAVQADHIEV
jgi:hypothetical protein